MPAIASHMVRRKSEEAANTAYPNHSPDHSGTPGYYDRGFLEPLRNVLQGAIHSQTSFGKMILEEIHARYGVGNVRNLGRDELLRRAKHSDKENNNLAAANRAAIDLMDIEQQYFDIHQQHVQARKARYHSRNVKSKPAMLHCLIVV